MKKGSKTGPIRFNAYQSAKIVKKDALHKGTLTASKPGQAAPETVVEAAVKTGVEIMGATETEGRVTVTVRLLESSMR